VGRHHHPRRPGRPLELGRLLVMSGRLLVLSRSLALGRVTGPRGPVRRPVARGDHGCAGRW
jgi:hypothetical protein